MKFYRCQMFGRSLILVFSIFCFLFVNTSNTVNAQKLPWEREIPLKEAAKSVFLRSTLAPDNSLPNRKCYPRDGKAVTINNLKMRTTLWGPPEQITISLTKNNVWDRRINPRGLVAPTLQEIVEGVNSPANKGFVGRGNDGQRPWFYGYLLKDGGYYDPYRTPHEYAMPCLKPVGQIIVGIDQLEGAQLPEIKQCCANGLTELELKNQGTSAKLQYVLGMTSNMYAIKGQLSGINKPIWLRLYRHKDTAHEDYMNQEGTKYIKKGTAADSAFNFPMDPPTSGTDGKYFWIRQKFPAEKTFPNGFEYILMGVLNTPGEVTVLEGIPGLGTPPPDKRIAKATGAASTINFSPKKGEFEALVTIVTSMDGDNLMKLAKERLAKAEKDGFDGILRENTNWWNAFYDKRENGRVFFGSNGTKCTEDILSIYNSYADHHGGGTHTDMTKYECAAEYVHPERDAQAWSSSPCYNEVFTTMHFVRNWPDHQQMWKQLVQHWMEGAKNNARDMFGMPGMAILHGYQPPVKPDKILHTTITLEFCLETMAQIIRPAWDEWDYGGDINVLRNDCYPLLKEMAIFYAAYAKKGGDGFYHITPSMDPEKWGWYGGLAKNKDVISSLCMFKWALNKAAEASEILNVDKDLRSQWREVAGNLAPYPIWKSAEGPMYCAIEGVEPIHYEADHFGEAAQYPVLLSDDITLDSPKEQIEMMLRTSKKLHNAGTTGQTLTLLGQSKGEAFWSDFNAETLLNSRSGRIHLFPAVEKDKVVAFKNFQAKGAFLVSAAKNEKEVYFLNVEARNDNVCQIMNPWPGRSVTVIESVGKKPIKTNMDKSNGECIVFQAKAGQKFSLSVQK
ncbi:MAG: hypothetical protein JZU47_14400 [Prolixibacteraceae bacterium]|nr:hypothetical protein [Prolixibacteraceae bacterium]